MFLSTKCWYLFIMQWQEVPRKHNGVFHEWTKDYTSTDSPEVNKICIKKVPLPFRPTQPHAFKSWVRVDFSPQSTPQTSPCAATSAYQLRHPRWLLGITYACLRSYRTSKVFPPLPVLSSFIFIFRFSRQNVEWCGL